MKTLDVPALESEFIALRRAGKYEEVLDKLQALRETSTGALLGFVYLQTAHTLYTVSPRDVQECIDLTDKALPLLADSPRLLAQTLIRGLTYARRTLDFLRPQETRRSHRYYEAASKLIDEDLEEGRPWHGKLKIVMGYYKQDIGRPQRALDYFKEALAFYDGNAGPFGKQDRQCQVEIIWSAIGDVLLELGRRAEATKALAKAYETKDEMSAATEYLKGRLAADSRESAEAASHFKRAIEMGKALKDHTFVFRVAEAYAELLRRNGDWDALTALLDPIIHEAALERLPTVVLRLQRLKEPE